jgi:hypothetical protein
MVSRDLTKVLKDRFPKEPATRSYLAELSEISRTPELRRVPKQSTGDPAGGE